MRARWLCVVLLALSRPLFAGDPPPDPAGAARAAEAARDADEAECAGDHAKAAGLYERAAREAEKARDVALQVSILRRLASVRLEEGKPAVAVESSLHAATLASTLLAGLSDAQGSEARSGLSSLFEVGARAASEAGDLAALSFFLEAGRAGSLLESLGARDALRGVVVPKGLVKEEADARAAEAKALHAYAEAIHAGDLAAIHARRAEFLAARDSTSEVIGRIEREAKKAASVLYPHPFTLDEIRSHLRAGEALVSYALTEVKALAQVVTKDAARSVALGKTESIADAVEVLSASSPDADPAASIDDLRALVATPLALGSDVTRVLVSPDGALSLVPFSLLLGDREVAYVPSGTTYLRLLEERGKRGEGVLAVGDPDFAGDAAAPADVLVRRGRRFAPLPGTRAEAAAVGDVLLLGKDATEARLRAALASRPRWSALHIATHGLVDLERPSFSALVLAPSGDDDGLLTALEVYRMRVPADLVVLSASRSATGKVLRGEGILGLVRAFLYAGSPRVIGSLWNVDDDATSALMTKFHALWNPKTGSTGVGTAEALRRAQASVRAQERWKHPYYWAGWVLWGLPD